MSTIRTTKQDTNESTNAPSTTTNPFDTVFDGEDTDDEWWEDDDVSTKENQLQENKRNTKWPHPVPTIVPTVRSTNRASARKPDKRYSVHKPIRDKSTRRQKRQNAKAGIKVITNLTRHPAAAPILLQNPGPTPQRGCFVDLAALQALNGETQGNAGGFWKSKKGKQAPKEVEREDDTQPSVNLNRAYSQSNTNRLVPSPSKNNEELSPGDRPIVIGLSIPSQNVAEHTFSPQTAGSDTSKIVRSYERRTPTELSPETPTIIITPAQAVSGWSNLDSNVVRARAASSIYSQAPFSSVDPYGERNIPPVPQVPASHLEEERLRLTGLKSYFSPDSDDATMWDDDSVAPRSRVVSSCTVFEEDESPILARGGRARSISGASRSLRRPSIGTIGARRQSTGWWNYITTPFLTRSNTFAVKEIESQPAPALPSLSIAATKAAEAQRDEKNWQKEFSPLTPPTATTVTSDRWWDTPGGEQTPVLRETRHKVEASTGTLPILIPEIAGIGSVDSPSLSIGEPAQVQRTNTTSTFHTMSTGGFSPNDREIPVAFDTPPLKGQVTSSSTSPSQIVNINIHSASTQVIQPVRAAVVDSGVPPLPTPVTSTPPPPYSPAPARLKKYKPVFPPGHALGIQYTASQSGSPQYPSSPGPVSPGLQAAMTSQGAIPMSDVPLTPASTRRPINLNSGYPSLPDRQDRSFFLPNYSQNASKKTRKAEAKRQRHEKEDALAHRAGGLWRGRGCFPDRGCYGRGGAEGRKRRRWYIILVVGFLSIIILAVVLATQLVRRPNVTEEPSQWLNLTGFPPIFTGLSTIVAPNNIEADTGCVFPATEWSCQLPKELQTSSAPNKPDQPRFLLRIQWDNSTEANTTFANVTKSASRGKRAMGGNAVSAGQFVRHLLLKARQAVTIVPTPNPPTFAEQFFLGNTTDSVVSDQKAGEPTPFYISFLSTTDADLTNGKILQGRQNRNKTVDFPDAKAVIPPPSLSADGTAAPANLLPFPSQQPLRLYDRGLKTEHYSFYTFYDRSIFLKSVDALNETNKNNGPVPDDLNGGARASEAKFRCTWRETRFLVQIWTRMNDTSRLLNSTRLTAQKVDTGGPVNVTLAQQDFTQPGSFPYPVTITVDRHGGDPGKKMLYCYAMDSRRQLIATSGQLHDENRGFGGTLINKAPTFFRNSSDPSLGGFDGGTGGCACKWRNFEDVIRV